jgi:ATP-dependent RNA helicase SUPV3L1/SUV3
VKSRTPLTDTLRAALAAIIAKRLAPLIAIRDAAFDPASPPAARALLATMIEDGGFLPRLADDPLTKALTPEDRPAIRRLGVTIASLGIYHRSLIKPEAVRLRLALHAAYRGLPMPPLPMAGLTLLDQPAPVLAAAALRAGYVRLNDVYLRVDLADRIAHALHKQREAAPEFRPDPQLATAIGLGQATYAAMLHTLGFIPAGKHAPDLWKWHGRARPPRQRTHPRKRREARRA